MEITQEMLDGFDEACSVLIAGSTGLPDLITFTQTAQRLVRELSSQLASKEKDLTYWQERYHRDTEKLRMQVTACGVAAMSNTPDTAAKNRIPESNEYYTASLGDVYRAVDREMQLREIVKDLVRVAEELRQKGLFVL